MNEYQIVDKQIGILYEKRLLVVAQLLVAERAHIKVERQIELLVGEDFLRQKMDKIEENVLN